MGDSCCNNADSHRSNGDRKLAKAAEKAERKARKGEKRAWKKARPKGGPWISPNLWVTDVRAAAQFYERTFGFRVEHLVEGSQGTTVHASLRHRKGVIMLGTGWGPGTVTGPLQPPEGLKGTTVSLYVYTRDVDALAETAKAAGCQILTPPTDEFWGDRCTRIVDPFGHCWMFATHKSAPAAEPVSEAIVGEISS